MNDLNIDPSAIGALLEQPQAAPAVPPTMAAMMAGGVLPPPPTKRHVRNVSGTIQVYMSLICPPSLTKYVVSSRYDYIHLYNYICLYLYIYIVIYVYIYTYNICITFRLMPLYSQTIFRMFHPVCYLATVKHNRQYYPHRIQLRLVWLIIVVY